jgi:hypothetical protein
MPIVESMMLRRFTRRPRTAVPTALRRFRRRLAGCPG